MTVKKSFKSAAFEAIHSAAAGLHSVEAISQETMLGFDKTSIQQVENSQPYKNGKAGLKGRMDYR